MGTTETAPIIVYLTRGRLRLKGPGEPAEDWVSGFGEQVRERHRSIQRRHAWKSQGRGARFATWGAPEAEDLPGTVAQSRFTSVSGGRRAGEILYVLEAGDVSAILGVQPDSADPEELRLFHSAEARLTGLAMAPGQDRIATCVAYPSGATNLALLTRDGSHLTDVTEGDSIDAAPRWAAAGRLVYQTAGVARDESGLPAGRGPFAIWELDTGRGEVRELVSSGRHDLLTPSADSTGALYFVRRPYTPPGQGPGIGPMLLDILLLPFRVVRALFAWLEFFVVRYTGKPLTSAGGPRREGPDERQLFLLGNIVDVEKARRESLKAGDEAPALVPQSWELVRKRTGGEEVVARGVLAFHVDAADTVWFTNGNAVFRIRRDGSRELVCEDEQVEAVYTLDSSSG